MGGREEGNVGGWEGRRGKNESVSGICNWREQPEPQLNRGGGGSNPAHGTLIKLKK